MQNGTTYQNKQGGRTTVSQVHTVEASNGARFLVGKVYSTDRYGHGWEGWQNEREWNVSRSLHEAR